MVASEAMSLGSLQTIITKLWRAKTLNNLPRGQEKRSRKQSVFNNH